MAHFSSSMLIIENGSFEFIKLFGMFILNDITSLMGILLPENKRWILMRSRNFKTNSMVFMLILAAFTQFLVVDEAEGIGTRAPNDVKGHVTSNATWDYHLVNNVVIDPGVTVTIPAGGQIWFPDDGFFFIEGTLKIQGSEGNEATLTRLISSGTWKGIFVNSTGSVDIQYAMIEYGELGLVLEGEPSKVSDTEFNYGEIGIRVISNDHSMDRINFENQEIVGVHFLESTGPNYINDSSFSFIFGGYGLFIEDSKYLYTDGLTMSVVGTGIWIKDSSHLYINNTDMDTGFSIPNSVGIKVDHRTALHMDRIQFNGLGVDNYEYGISFDGVPAGWIYFIDMRIGSTVDIGIFHDRAIIYLKIFDSSIEAATSSIDIGDGGYEWQHSHIELINTTMSGGPVIIERFGEVEQSWYLDLSVVDPDLEPVDCLLGIWNGTTGLRNVLLRTGTISDLPIRSALWGPDESGTKVETHLVITRNDESQAVLVTDEMWFHQNEKWILVMDQWPTNNLSAVLEVDEDEWLNLDLNDNFTDPEGQDLYFEFLASPELQVNQVGGHGSSTLKIRGAEDNWFGDGWLYVNATDPSGNMTEANVTVSVLSVNDRPFLIDPPLPELEVEEDSSVYINFTGMADDVESNVTWASDDVNNCVLTWDDSHINLTITPDENWFGMIEIPLNISDSEEWLHETLSVNVTSVNDIPEIAFMWWNDTVIGTVEYAWNETVNITVYEITTVEDVIVDFWINATDIESVNLTYYFDEGAPEHGEVKVKHIIDPVNGTMDEYRPMYFSYTPAENDHTGDLVMFNVSDGEADLGLWVWFNVESRNDPPNFDPPADWNITVGFDNLTVIDIADMIADVDGDDLTITVDPSDYVTVNGTSLEILFTDVFEGNSEDLTITVSDGDLGATADLLINIHREGPEDPVDDDEPVLGTLKVTPKDDGWFFEVTGDEGQTLFVVIEDENGDLTSYPMTYADGRYSVKIEKDDADPGFSYYLSNEKDGGSLGNDMEGTLNDLAELGEENDDDKFPLWALLLLLVIAILLMIIIVMAVSRKRGKEEYDEE